MIIAIVARSYFIVQPIGVHYTIECPIPPSVHDDVIVWVDNNDGVTIISPHINNGTSLEVEFNPIKDTDHNKVFNCHNSDTANPLMFSMITLGKIIKYYNASFYVLYLEPSNPVLSVSFPISEVIPISGQSISLQCTSTKLNTGFTGQPDILWFLPSTDFASNANTTIGDIQTYSVLSINETKTSDAGLYSCLSSLETVLTSIFITSSVDQILVIKSEI